MEMKSNVICPHLIGGSEGATCGIVRSFIRDMEDADIRLCMTRRYEACSIYVRLLQEEAIRFINLNTADERL